LLKCLVVICLGKIRNVTGAVERKNRYLQEMIKTILNEFDSSKYFLGGSCKIASLYQTPIRMRYLTKVGKHINRFHAKFHPNPTIGLRALFPNVNIGQFMTFSSTIQIFLFNLHIKSYQFSF
jgi:hypothetical protein